jgi:hypothetical protein
VEFEWHACHNRVYLSLAEVSPHLDAQNTLARFSLCAAGGLLLLDPLMLIDHR